MKKVICNFNLFDIEQKIIVVGEDKEMNVVAVSDFVDLGTNIAKTCQMEKCYDVHLYGQEDYIQTAVVPALEEYLLTSYGYDELNIEVN